MRKITRIRLLVLFVAIHFACVVPLTTLAQSDFWGDTGTVVGYSKVNAAERTKLYNKWIQDYKVHVDSDGSRTIVRHQHSDQCRKNGYCTLKRNYVQVEVSKTNRIGRIVSDLARIRLDSELDAAKQSWLVEVIDATAIPSIQINPSAKEFDANWIIVDFERLEDHELYDDRVFETPLNRKKEARRVQVPVFKGSPSRMERKLPVFCDQSEVFDYVEKTNIIVEAKSDVVETPVRYLKPTMQDFAKWIQAGNSMSYHMKFTDTCPSCKHRGRWTEWRDGKQQIVTCSECNGSGSIWIEKDVTVRGP